MKFLLSVNYSFNVVKITANKDSITAIVNVCIYGMSVYWPLSVLCVFGYVCVFASAISN